MAKAFSTFVPADGITMAPRRLGIMCCWWTAAARSTPRGQGPSGVCRSGRRLWPHRVRPLRSLWQKDPPLREISVYPHPNLVVLLDDVEGRGRHYYKCSFQIGGSATLGDGKVDLRNGRAAAAVVFCNLDKQRGYRIMEETRVSHYTPFVDDHPGQSPATRSFSVGSLHRENKWLLGTVVFIGEASSLLGRRCEVQFSVDSRGVARFVCSYDGSRSEVVIDRSSRAISLTAK